MARTHSGAGTGRRAFLRKPLNEHTGRVYLAGDWFTYTVAWQHGAFESVRKAVTVPHARVPAPS